MVVFQRTPHHCLVIDIFKALVKSGWDDPVGMNPRSLKRQVVGRVGINYIICHLCLQVSDLASKTDLPSPSYSYLFIENFGV